MQNYSWYSALVKTIGNLLYEEHNFDGYHGMLAASRSYIHGTKKEDEPVLLLILVNELSVKNIKPYDFMVKNQATHFKNEE